MSPVTETFFEVLKIPPLSIWWNPGGNLSSIYQNDCSYTYKTLQQKFLGRIKVWVWRFQNIKKSFDLHRVLLDLHPDWKNENLELLGETWTSSDALAGKTYEGFFEAGPQLIVLTCLQLQANWPSMQPLIRGGTLRKAYYFSSSKPGNLKTN